MQLTRSRCPAVFIMFLAGFIVIGAALVPMKRLMIVLQYYHKAEERRFGGTGPR